LSLTGTVVPDTRRPPALAGPWDPIPTASTVPSTFF